jgi:hypothetical protein
MSKPGKADQGLNAKSEPSEPFGPFLDIPSAEIRFSGWPCKRCRRPVRKFGAVVPSLVPRMMFFVCRCGTVAAWEDERQPSQKTWPDCAQLLRDSGAGMVVFNGDKPTAAGFQGVN